jgi:hypothetical protein
MKVIGVLWNEVVYYGYFEILRPFYKSYDYDFRRINFKHKNIPVALV